MRSRRSPSVLCLTLGLLLCGGAEANVQGYTSLASFQAASAGFTNPQTLNFDGLTVGALIPSGTTVGGLNFVYTLSGNPNLQVDSGFPTTSGSNYLGLDNGNGAFYTGTSDAFTVNFDHVVDAIGLYVLAGSAAAGDFTLSAGTGTVLNDSTADQSFADGSHAYYLGLVESSAGAGFTSFTLSSNGQTAGFYAFNVDDIASAVSPVPEPEPARLALAGALAILLRSWRAGRRSARRTSQRSS